MKPSVVVGWLTQLTLWAVWLLLGGRLILRLFNADVTNRFVSWVYDISHPVIEPFFGWFPLGRTGDGFVFELPTLFALVAYTFLGFAVLAATGQYARRADGAVPKVSFGVVVRRRE